MESQGNFSNMTMKSSPLNPSCKLPMADHDIHLMKAFRSQLQQVGITFEETPCNHTVRSVCVRTVPSVFLERESLDNGKTLHSEIKNYIQV